MVSEDASKNGSSATRSYILMKAKTETALELAAEHWGSKSIPSYIKVEQLQKGQSALGQFIYNDLLGLRQLGHCGDVASPRAWLKDNVVFADIRGPRRSIGKRRRC